MFLFKKTNPLYSRVPFKKVIIIGFLPGFIKKFFYKWKGYKIGKNVKFSIGSIIDVSGECIIDNNSTFGIFCFIKSNHLKIGKNCKIRSFTLINVNNVNIGDDVIISETSIIRAQQHTPKSMITIENKVHIFPFSLIDASYPIIIGEETGIGFYTSIFTHSAYKNVLDGYKVIHKEVVIGKRVELTYNVFISPGVTIGDDAIIAYGSFVNSDIPSGALAAGCPAKIKRRKEEFAPNPDDGEKIQIIIDILNDFSEHISYFYQFEIIHSESDIWSFTKKKTWRCFLFNAIPSDFKPVKYDVIVSLKEIPEKYKLYLKKDMIQWFDCQKYLCSNNLDDFGNKLKEYFERYGIRLSKI